MKEMTKLIILKGQEYVTEGYYRSLRWVGYGDLRNGIGSRGEDKGKQWDTEHKLENF